MLTTHALKFREEAGGIIARPPSAVQGIFLPDGTLVAVGVGEKAGYDFDYWTVTWIVVDFNHRQKGLGKVVVDTLLAHAKSEQEQYRNPNCRVLISAVLNRSSYYERGWGFKTLVEGPLPCEALMFLDVMRPGLQLRPLP